MQNFDYQKGSEGGGVMNVDIMHDIKEDFNEQDSQLNQVEKGQKFQQWFEEETSQIKAVQKKKNDQMITKIANKLEDNKKLDKFEKNLIKFNDVIHSVTTERKRKKVETGVA
jgi:hypothetical protein